MASRPSAARWGSITYNTNVISVAEEDVVAGKDLPDGDSVFVNVAPANNCDGDSDQDTDENTVGLVVGWVNHALDQRAESQEGAPVPTGSGSIEVLKVCFTPIDGAADTGNHSLHFVDGGEGGGE